MTTENPQVRRATIEDLPQLIKLWQIEGLPLQEMEKRFKEFQVIESGDTIVALLGLQIVGLEGRLHSEAFARPEEADALRALFWERVQVLAQNHGLIRVWTQFTTPFWNRSGFQAASPEKLEKVPAAFAGNPYPWRYFQLREDPANHPSIEKEFAMFKEIEQERTQRLLRHAKLMKFVAAVVVMAVFVLIAFWLITWYKTQGQARPR
jgi:N-acetylglutamate synthase-like GNAT family acetyltransferase